MTDDIVTLTCDTCGRTDRVSSTISAMGCTWCGHMEWPEGKPKWIGGMMYPPGGMPVAIVKEPTDGV